MADENSGIPSDLSSPGNDAPITGQPLADDGLPMSDIAREILADSESHRPTKRPAAKAIAATPPEHPDGEDDGSDADDLWTGQKEDAPKKQSYKVKANGKTYEFDSVDKLVAAAGRGLATQQTWQKEKASLEAQKKEMETVSVNLRQQMEFIQQQVERLQKSPEEFLRKLPNADQVAEKLLMEKAQEWEAMQSMTPREREYYQREKEAKAKIADYESKQKKFQEDAQEKLVEEQKEALARVMGEALEKHSLPKNTTTLRVMAGIMRAHAAKGISLNAEQAATLARGQLNGIAKETFAGMKPEDFVSQFPELADGIRKYYVQQVKSKPREVAEVPQRVTRKSNGQFQKPDADDGWEKELSDLKRRGHAENLKNRVY